MKKTIGFIAWLLAFSIPFRYSLLNADELVHADGTPNNTIGLISYVAFLALVFIGYWLVDSAQPKNAGHGH